MIPLDFAIAAGVVFSAMVIRGFTGFGGALLMVPLLGLIWEIRLVIVVVAVIEMIAGSMLAFMGRKSVDRATLIPILIWSIIGLAGGSLLLATLPIAWIARILGVVTIFIGIVSLTKRIAVPVRPGRSRGVLTSVVGLVAGVLHGLLGTSGPVIVPYLQRTLPAPQQMRSTLLAYFIVLEVLRLGGYVQLGIASIEAFERGLLLAPVAIVGSLIGSRLHVQVSDEVFRVAVSVLLIVSGMLLLT